jgi:RNA polymerase sigma-70 factor, ECF subfamily
MQKVTPRGSFSPGGGYAASVTSSWSSDVGLAVRPRETADPDDDLVDRARVGDLVAFEVLVERHQDIVLRVAARIVGDNDASDVAQDAFLRAFHRLDRFRGEAPFRTWLLRIVHNSALDTLARRHERPSDLQSADEPFALVLNSPTIRPPADQLEVAERHDRLTLKLQSMSEQHRAVLVLRDLEGLSYEEIADITDAPLGSVKGRLHRARKEMISLLRANTYDWELPDD